MPGLFVFFVFEVNSDLGAGWMGKVSYLQYLE